MKRLWQALDPVSAHVLLTLQGAESFLLSFPAEQRDALARATAQALDSEVADDTTAEQALTVFSSLVADDLTDYLQQETGSLTSMPASQPRKPVLPS